VHLDGFHYKELYEKLVTLTSKFVYILQKLSSSDQDKDGLVCLLHIRCILWAGLKNVYELSQYCRKLKLVIYVPTFFNNYIAYTYKLYSTYGVPKISWSQILLISRYFKDRMADLKIHFLSYLLRQLS
jgi:hypothetical protein